MAKLLLLLLLLPLPSRQLDLDFCRDNLGVGLPHPPPADITDSSKQILSKLIPDERFTASSSFDRVSVGPHNARLHLDEGGGAWCPSKPVGGGGSIVRSASSNNNNNNINNENGIDLIKDGDVGSVYEGEEFLQIDLGNLTVITHVLTQGRFGKGVGREYSEAYSLDYWRSGMQGFKRYRDLMGRELSPSIIASKLRILPRPLTVSAPNAPPRTVCLRIGLEGCKFQEGVLSYSMPQGEVRGRQAELVDHAFDGREDSGSGHLRGGLGQLVDGIYGEGDGKEDGYEWVGWKRKYSSAAASTSPPVSLVFAFDSIRSFERVDIFADNHFTKDVQVFKEAKVYFSNEEDKFGDDRRVDFNYMPDASIQLARNVSVRLHGQHGKFVMVQLYFAAKWIVISEVTFISEAYVEKPYSMVPLPEDQDGLPNMNGQDSQDLVMVSDDLSTPPTSNKEEDESSTAATSTISPTYFGDDSISRSSSNGDAGVVIGILLFVILALLFAILYVVARGRDMTSDRMITSKTLPSSTPAHSLLPKQFGTSKYHPPAVPVISNDPNSAITQETIYEEPQTSNMKLYTASSGFLSLSRKFSSEIVLSEDNDDDHDYALPITTSSNMTTSNSHGENIYAQAINASPPPVNKTTNKSVSAVSSPARRALIKPLPLSHYARPLTPPQKAFSPAAAALVGSPLMSRRRPSQQSNHSNSIIMMGNDQQTISPPRYTNTLSTPPLPPARTTTATTTSQTMFMRRPNLDTNANNSYHQHPPPTNATNMNNLFLSVPQVPSPSSSLASSSIAPKADLTTTDDDNQTQDDDDVDDEFNLFESSPYNYYNSDLRIPNEEQDLASLYKQIDETWQRQRLEQQQQQQQQQQQLRNSNSLDLIAAKAELKDIPRSRLRRLDKLGEGQFGEIHLCTLQAEMKGEEDTIVAVKELRRDSNQPARLDFETEALVLTSLSDPNIVSVLGVCLSHPGRQPLTMICEYGRYGDLYHYLQDHVQANSSASSGSTLRSLSYNRLIHMASQVASGMKYLEALNFVHRDLATRNCLVGSCKTIKISDFGLSRPCFRSDYFLSQSGCLLPVRWMAWESVLLGRYTAKSDVWSFGVTLWEILTLAREQPYEQLTDEQVVANLSSMYKDAKSFKRLPRPRGCPREVGDLMEECWRREASQRPSFREIHMFLQRKNLGYSPDDDDNDAEEQVVTRLV